MEDEIHLGEILAALWQGKYLILAVTVGAMLIALVVSVLTTTPLYKAEASLDPAPYDLNSEELVRRLDNEKREVLAGAAQELGKTPGNLAANLSVQTEGDLVLITLKTPDQEKAPREVELIGADLLEWAADLRLEQLAVSKTNHEASLIAVEEELKELEPELDDFYEELASRKESLESSLEIVEGYIDERYGDKCRQGKLLAMEFDPSCIALLEQKGNLMVDLAETRAKLQKLDRGLLTRELLKEDPYYSYLLEQRDRYQTRIHSTAHRMEELKELTGEVPPDNQMQNITVTSEPVNINWPLNTAVAGVLGLMLSVFIVFTKPFVAELKEELKEKE